MSLTIKKNGQDLTNFSTLIVNRDILNVCGEFIIHSTADKDNLFPIKVGETVEILADGKLILTAFVERLSINVDGVTHGITAGGRGVLCDFVDSSIGGDSVGITGKLSLKLLAELLLRSLGMKNEVIDKAGLDGESGAIKDFEESEIESIGVAQNVFTFLEAHARKRQVLLNSDEKGNLVLTRANNVVFEGRLKQLKGNNDNNILSSNLSIDDSFNFNKYIAYGQLNPTNQKKGTSEKDLSSQVSATVVNEQVRETRQFAFHSEENSNGETLTKRALWEMNVKNAKSFTYKVTVQGHTILGKVWEYNRLIQVDDDFSSINGKIFISGVSFKDDINSGSTTELKLTFTDAFRLKSEVIKKVKKRKDKQGGILYLYSQAFAEAFKRLSRDK